MNLLLLVLSSLGKFFLGAIWHSIIFAKIYIKNTHGSEEKAEEAVKKSKIPLPLFFLYALTQYFIQTYVLFKFLEFINPESMKFALFNTFIFTFGFYFSPTSSDDLFELKNIKVCLIHYAFNFTSILINTAVWFYFK
jgi:hypothetical protein